MHTDRELDSWLALVTGGRGGDGMSETQWAEAVDAARPAVDDALAALLDAGRATDALRAVDALGAYWHSKGAFEDGVRWGSRVLERAPEETTATRARVLMSSAVMLFRTGRTEECRMMSEKAITMARAVGDPAITVGALCSLARVGLRDNDIELVRSVCTEAMSVADQAQRPELHRLPLHCLAEGTRIAGDLDGARPLYQQSIELNTRLGNEEMVAMEQSNLAALETAVGNTAIARALLTESLPTLQRMGDRYILPYALLNMGGVALQDADPHRAAQLLAAADAIFKDSGAAIDPADQPVFDRHVAAAHGALGDPEFAAAWSQGRALTDDAAIDVALSRATPS